MGTGMRYLAQGIVYTVFAVAIYIFSIGPTYTHLESDKAMIKLSFAHATKPKGECKVLTREELAKLAPNMRRPKICPRERMKAYVELELDGKPTYQSVLLPTGFHSDGAVRVYERVPVPAGKHTITVRMRDTARENGFDYEVTREVDMVPGQNFAIDFNAPKGGFIFE